jgi:tetratricopeptide (TPR) repeat protein
MKKIVLTIFTILMFGCTNSKEISISSTSGKSNAEIMNIGKLALRAHKPKVAMTYFDKVIASGEKDKMLYADAVYNKGYAYIDLKNLKEAKKWIQKSMKLSPEKSLYVSELGYIYQRERDWKNSLKMYTKAEKLAKTYSEIGRALRGKGYVFVEQKEFSKAKKEYKKAIKINSNDKLSVAELKYIASKE